MIASEQDARDYLEPLCDEQAQIRLSHLAHSLGEENERQNLVAKGTLANVWQRHIADSAQLLSYVSRETGPWVDLGSGAGFPGLVLAVLTADSEVILIESRKKRIDWLERMVKELELKNCRIIGDRVENVGGINAGAITARAFASLDNILSLSKPLSTDRTVFVLPKGRSAAQELQAMPKRVRQTFHVEQSLTDPDAGILVGRLSKKARAAL